MDGLKAEPARSLPLPVTGAEMNEEETMARGRAKDKRLLVGCEMPPLYHTLPGETYDAKKSEVLNWISERPGLLTYMFDKLVSGKYIFYDPDTGKWQGVDYDD